jgi:hypothetical protein
MDYRSPGTDDLCLLVRAALSFFESTPWRQLDWNQPFGVRDPETNRVILAMVNGRLGTDFGLSAYPGADGFVTMHRIIHGLIPEVNEESLHEIRSFLCGFASRSTLKTSDRQLLKDAGCDLRRGRLVPLFRSFVPGYFPWQLDADEARLLTLLLRQSSLVARDVARHPRLFEGAPRHSYLTRHVMDDAVGPPEAYEWAAPDIPDSPPMRVRGPDELTSARLSRLPIDEGAEWEVALATGAGVVQPSPGVRPQMLLTLFVVDRGSGYIHHGEPMSASGALGSLQRVFAGVLLSLGFAPRRILVRNHAQREQLAPVARLTGSKLLRVQRLPQVEEASTALHDFMTGRG